VLENDCFALIERMKLKEYLMFFTGGMPISLHLLRSAHFGMITIL